MKKISKFSMMAVVFLTTLATYAGNADFLLYVKKGEGKAVQFALNGVTKVNLSVYDEDDKLIHTEKATAGLGIKRTYDLSELPVGTYFLEAETDIKIARYKINVTNRAAILSEKAISEVYKPVLTNKSGMVSLNIHNTEKSPVEVKIYDSADNEVYNNTLPGELNVSKQFDITQNAGDKYTFVMSYNNKMFVQTIASR